MQASNDGGSRCCGNRGDGEKSGYADSLGMGYERRIRIFDLPNGRIGFPLTEVENAAGGVKFQGKDWSYVLDIFEIPVSHPSEDVKQTVGYGILWHLRERFGRRNKYEQV